MLSSLAFGAGGIAFLVYGVRTFRASGAMTERAWQFAAFGLLFTLVNALVVGAVVWSVRRRREVARLRTAHPEKPWMWRQAWHTGRIPERGSRWLIGLWIFTIVLNLGSLELWLTIPRLVSSGRTGAFFLLAFPLLGLLFLGLAIQGSLRRRRFGRSELVLTTNPLPIGGTFAAMVEAPVPREVFADARINATLVCVERIKRRRRNDSGTVESVLWQETTRVSGSRVGAGLDRAMIPISCAIPRGLQSTTVEDDDRMIVWRVIVNAKVPGVDYEAAFEVPAFDVARPK